VISTTFRGISKWAPDSSFSLHICLSSPASRSTLYSRLCPANFLFSTLGPFFAIVALTFVEDFFLSFDSSPPTLPQTRSASRDRPALPEASRFRPFRPPLFALLDSALFLPTFPILASLVLPPFSPSTESVRVSTVSYAFRFHLAPVIWESYQDLFCDLHRSRVFRSWATFPNPSPSYIHPLVYSRTRFRARTMLRQEIRKIQATSASLTTP
ncbi:hypothetical protein EDB89DRAFT_2152073, partial [Lactarius sanguifluus]